VFTRARARGNARYRLARAEAELFSRLTGECATVRERFSRFPKMFHSQKKRRRTADPLHVSPWRMNRLLFTKRVSARAHPVSSYFFRHVSSLPSSSFRFIAEKWHRFV